MNTGIAEQTFAPEPASVSAARRFVSTTLDIWNFDEVVWNATVIVSELATNAVLHAGTDFTVVLRPRAGSTIRIEVGDGVRRQPQIRHFGPEAATGRGMALVSELASNWGVQPVFDGKVVWCELNVGSGERLPDADETSAADDINLEQFMSPDDFAEFDLKRQGPGGKGAWSQGGTGAATHRIPGRKVS